MLVVAPSLPTQAIARHVSLLARHQVCVDTSQMRIEFAREER